MPAPGAPRGGGSQSDAGNLPRNWANNNPLNIEDGRFAQSQPGYAGGDGRFARFDTPENGFRAANANLDHYASLGVTTPAAIINRWAPASDGNNPAAYAATLAKNAGLDPNAPIGSDPASRAKLLAGMSQVEGGIPSRYAPDAIAGMLGGGAQQATAPGPATPGAAPGPQASAEPSLRDTILAAAGQSAPMGAPPGAAAAPPGTPASSAVALAPDGSGSPSLRDTISAAMDANGGAGQASPASAPPASSPSGSPSVRDAVTFAVDASGAFPFDPAGGSSSAPPPSAGGLGAAPAVGSMPSPGDGSMPGSGALLPATGPMPPPGAQSLALAAALRSGAPAGLGAPPAKPPAVGPAAPSDDGSAPVGNVADADTSISSAPRGPRLQASPSSGSPPPPPPMAMASDPIATSPGQQAINGAMGNAPPPNAGQNIPGNIPGAPDASSFAPAAGGPSGGGPSPNPQALAAALSAGPAAGMGGNDPSSADAFAHGGMGGGPSPQALVAALMNRSPGSGALPPAGPSPQMLAAGLQNYGRPQQPPAPGAPGLGTGTPGGSAPQGSGQPQGQPPGDPMSIARAIYMNPYASDADRQMAAGMLMPSYGYQKMDDGTLVRVDPRGGPPQVVYQGGKFTSGRNGVPFNERTGLGPDGRPVTGYRMATPSELQGLHLPADASVQVGPNGEFSVLNAGGAGGPQADYNSDVAKSVAAPQISLMNGVEDARTRLRSLNEMSGALQRIQQNGGTTGIGAEEMKHLQSAINTGASTLGITEPFDISDKEIMSKVNGQLAGAMAKGMAGGRVTNFDFKQYQENNPGLELSPTGNQRMLGIMSQIEQRNIAVGQSMRDMAGGALAKGQRIDPTQMDGVIRAYDASHHIVDPVTGQDLTANPKLPDLQGAPSAPGAPPASGAPAPAPQPPTASARPPQAAPIRVNTPADAMRLPPGTRFMSPDGAIRVVPGGPAR